MEYAKFTSFDEFFKAVLPYRKTTAFTYLEEGEIKNLSFSDFHKKVLDKRDFFKRMNISSLAIIKSVGIDMISSILGSCLAGIRTTLISPLMPIESMVRMLKVSETEQLDISEEDFEDLEVKSLYSSLSEPKKNLSNKEGSFIFFTSGTTSLSKPVEIEASSFLDSAYEGQSRLSCSENDVILSALPLEHVFGFVCSFLWPLIYGATIAIGSGIRSIIEDINTFKPTILPLIPSLTKLLVLRNGFNRECKTILVGAGPLDENTITAIRNKGMELAYGYGLTETASGVAISVNSSEPSIMGFCPGDKFRLEEDGTLSIKSDSMMKGYFNNKKATDEVLSKDGWLHTNDLAVLDEEHKTLRILGRKDDIIVLSNGTKFNCAEGEDMITRIIPSVDFALFNDKGQASLIYYSKAINANDLVTKAVNMYNRLQPMSRRITNIFCSPTLLPRTKTGKIQRYKLSSSVESK